MPKVPDEPKPRGKGRRHFKDVVIPPRPLPVIDEATRETMREVIREEGSVHEQVTAEKPPPRNDCLVDITTFLYKDFVPGAKLADWLDRILPELVYNEEYAVRLQITKVSR